MERLPSLEKSKGLFAGPRWLLVLVPQGPFGLPSWVLLPPGGGVHGSPNIPHSRFSFLAEKVGRVSSPRLPAKRDQREYFMMVMRGTSHNLCTSS